MQSQPQLVETPAAPHNGAALHHAMDTLQSGATRAVAGTENLVRRYPLASIGVAVGAGIAVGVAAHHLLMPRRQRSVLERLGLVAVVASAARGLGKLF